MELLDIANYAIFIMLVIAVIISVITLSKVNKKGGNVVSQAKLMARKMKNPRRIKATYACYGTGDTSAKLCGQWLNDFRAGQTTCYDDDGQAMDCVAGLQCCNVLPNCTCNGGQPCVGGNDPSNLANTSAKYDNNVCMDYN